MNMKLSAINYRRIADAIEFYTKRGYQYIEVPWLVSVDSIDVTKPPEARYFETFAGHLVASGEQSFLEIRSDLCPGRKYQCVTPCFRDEHYTKLNQPQFLKLELILPLWKDDDAEKYIKEVQADAGNFFHQLHGRTYSAKTDIGYDLFVGDYEVGSYGVREHNMFRWVYGTGVAEPRLSQALQKLHDDWTAEQRVKNEQWEKDNPDIAELMK